MYLDSWYHTIYAFMIYDFGHLLEMFFLPSMYQNTVHIHIVGWAWLNILNWLVGHEGNVSMT